jgi:hypothetical protein
MLQTRVTRLLGIEHPIACGGMAGHTSAELPAAVSNGGGLGIHGCSFLSPEQIRRDAARIRELTERPFGLNLLLCFATDEQIRAILEARPPAPVDRLGRPGDHHGPGPGRRDHHDPSGPSGRRGPAGGVRQDLGVDVNDHLIVLARGSGVERVVQGRLDEQRQGVGLLLGQRGRCPGRVETFQLERPPETFPRERQPWSLPLNALQRRLHRRAVVDTAPPEPRPAPA